MQIVALLACRDYESDELLGMYSSREEAVAAAAAYVASDEYISYDGFVVEYRTLGAAAQSWLTSDCVREEFTV